MQFYLEVNRNEDNFYVLMWDRKVCCHCIIRGGYISKINIYLFIFDKGNTGRRNEKLNK